MEDLEYILGIGFSGDDIPRAVILAFLFAMFARKDTNVWIYGLFALLIDRTVWPIAAMGASGADLQSIYASIGALFETFMDDVGLYFVRYMGLVLMILAFSWVRGWLHGVLPGGKAAHA
ncbi:MAG: hypothetical protein AAGD92_08135 [Pseudomonadota bacterium]